MNNHFNDFIAYLTPRTGQISFGAIIENAANQADLVLIRCMEEIQLMIEDNLLPPMLQIKPTTVWIPLDSIICNINVNLSSDYDLNKGKEAIFLQGMQNRYVVLAERHDIKVPSLHDNENLDSACFWSWAKMTRAVSDNLHNRVSGNKLEVKFKGDAKFYNFFVSHLAGHGFILPDKEKTAIMYCHSGARLNTRKRRIHLGHIKSIAFTDTSMLDLYLGTAWGCYNARGHSSFGLDANRRVASLVSGAYGNMVLSFNSTTEECTFTARMTFLPRYTPPNAHPMQGTVYINNHNVPFVVVMVTNTCDITSSAVAANGLLVRSDMTETYYIYSLSPHPPSDNTLSLMRGNPIICKSLCTALPIEEFRLLQRAHPLCLLKANLKQIVNVAPSTAENPWPSTMTVTTETLVGNSSYQARLSSALAYPTIYPYADLIRTLELLEVETVGFPGLDSRRFIVMNAFVNAIVNKITSF